MRALAAVLALSFAGCLLPELQQEPEATDTDACLSCAETNCAATYDACIANLECEALVLCAYDCAPSDIACLTGCTQDHPDGVDDALVLGECTDTECSTACPASSP